MSDLLNSASLVMIPSGYKEDVVYSQIPTSGAGDLSFTRASNGTRVNSAGLVEVCPWNLCTNSEDQTQWTSQNATTVTANSTIAPNGTLTADTVTPTAVNDDHYRGIGLSSQVGELTAFIYVKPNGYNFFDWGIWNGSSYLVRATFDLVNLTYTFTNAGTATIESVGNGWLKCGISGSNASLSTIDLYYRVRPTGGAGAFTGNGTSGAFIWGAQLNIGSTAKPYFPTTDRLNVPRLTYQNGGGGCPSLLLEKQSTNLQLYSQELDNAYWNKYDLTVTANNAISPDGTQNADLLTFDAIDTARLDKAVGGTYESQTHTVSVYAKVTSGTQQFRLKCTHANVVDYYSSDLTVTTEWQRFTFTQTFGASVGTGIVAGVINSSSGTAKSILFYGVQLEANSSYATSYIPTTSASATRVADACSKTGISSLIGTNQGTFFLDFVYIGQRESSSSYPYIFDILNASLDRLIMYGSATNVGYDTYDLWDSSNFVLGNINLYYNTRYKLAVKYSSSGVVCYLNGTLAVNSTASFNPQMSGFYLARRYSDTEINSLKVNQTIVFPTALSGTDLIALTTI